MKSRSPKTSPASVPLAPEGVPVQPAPAFVSLGMVVLDEIHFPDGRVLPEVAGGSGFYSTLGARLAVPETEAETICCLIVAGDDFPASVIQQIEGWGVKVHLQKIEESSSTRGLLRYKDKAFGAKTFEYTSPPLRPRLKELPEHLLRSTVVHTLASTKDLTQQADELRETRRMTAPARPSIIWEPSPLHCDYRQTETHFSRHLEVARDNVAVLSPNDEELLSMFEPGMFTPVCARKNVLELAAANVSSRDEFARGADGDHAASSPRTGSKRGGWVTVVRCGQDGCLTVPRWGRPLWLPPYYDAGSEKVVDATGAGNAFLGAFGVALEKTDDEILASAYGAVAASFAIEQTGPPKREVVDGKELWNGEEFGARLERYKAKATAHTTDLTDPDFFMSSRGCSKREKKLFS